MACLQRAKLKKINQGLSFKTERKKRMKNKKYFNKHINKQNKKFPLMEYFLDGKKLEACSKECQEQVKLLLK